MVRPGEWAPPIASRKNPLVRRIMRLDQDAALRQEEGVFLVWGWKMVEEALRESARLERLLVGSRTGRQAAGRALLRQVRGEAFPVSLVEEEILENALPGSGDQGVLALVRMSRTTADEMIERRKEPILLVADRIQDPGNMGTLIRLAEAAGAAGVLISPGTVDPYHTRAARASAGSILRVPVGRIPGPAEFSGWCRRRGMRIAATLPEGGTPCRKADLRTSLVLVVGNEGEGVAREWLDAAGLKLTVGMEGRVESLNVTLATAMILYEASRQRRAGEESL
jgi:RNA methyltransferase, TrmH family